MIPQSAIVNRIRQQMNLRRMVRRMASWTKSEYGRGMRSAMLADIKDEVKFLVTICR